MGRGRKDDMREAEKRLTGSSQKSQSPHAKHFMLGGAPGGIGGESTRRSIGPALSPSGLPRGRTVASGGARPMLPDYSPVTERSGAGLGATERMKTYKRPEREVAPALAPVIPEDRKPRISADPRVMTSNFTKHHIVALPGKDKAKSKREARRDIDKLFETQAEKISNERFRKEPATALSKNTVIGLTPKKMKRWNDALLDRDTQRELESGRTTLPKIKSRVVTHTRGVYPAIGEYGRRKITVENKARQQTPGTWEYPATHLPEQSFEISKSSSKPKHKKKHRKD